MILRLVSLLGNCRPRELHPRALARRTALLGPRDD
jgi:hypothetical protein